MEIYSLGSGSSGNTYIVLHQGQALLLDAGLSGRQTFTGLAAAGVDPGSVTAILVSHEHNDHVASAGILCRRLKVPLYMTAGTWQGARAKLGNIPADSLRLIAAGLAFQINGLEIWALPASHDALEPVNYIFNTGRRQAAVLTDTGVVTETVIRALSACDALILEANHDLEMLRQGPYPGSLKKRVAGENGHLSNLQAARILAQLAAKGRLTQAHLGHLSAINNSPEVAMAAVSQYLANKGLGSESLGRNLKVLPRQRLGPVLQVK